MKSENNIFHLNSICLLMTLLIGPIVLLSLISPITTLPTVINGNLNNNNLDYEPTDLERERESRQVNRPILKG